MIGWTAGGGMLEILRIEVNTCESQVMCPSNKQDWSDEASAIVVGAHVVMYLLLFLV